MKATVAVQRKLLEMAYTIYKTKKPYNAEYMQNKEETKPKLEEVL